MALKAVVLYSGGLDSTTCLAVAKKEGFTPYAISFAYGQRHSVELEMERKNARPMGAGLDLHAVRRDAGKRPAMPPSPSLP